MWDALRQWINNLNILPRGNSISWAPGLLWLRLLGDALLVAAFLAIPLTLRRFTRCRPGLQHRQLIHLFAAAIAGCGAVFALQIWNLWHRTDWLEVGVTAVAGLVAMTLAVALWRSLPRMLMLPGSAQYQAVSAELDDHRQRLQDSEARFHALAEASAQGIWTLDREGVIRFANPAMSDLLRCLDSMVGRSLFDFVFPEDQGEARQRFLQRLGGDRKLREFRWRRADGTAVYTMVSTAVMLAPNGAINGLMSVVDDISERVAMNAELQRLNLELGQRVEERTRELEESNRELARQIVVREYVQTELAASNERLNHYLATLQRHTNDISLLNELADQLNACESRRELVQVIQGSCHELFETDGGALFESVGTDLQLLEFGWGDCAGLESTFPPDQCLALRSGKPFPGNAAEQTGVVCTHRPSLEPALCVPLRSRGSMVGLLLLQRRDPFWTGDAFADRQMEQLIRALAEHAALALDNLALRERLREQSLSDALTGLFNRRYLFEQIAREMASWQRTRRPFAVMLIDIDHFKLFNDRYGHAIGDAVLVEVGALLRDYTRRSDVACRLGGEEFVVLMAGVEQEQAIRRAEAIREAVKKLALPGVNEVISISAGVAMYPQHGGDQQALLHAADQALYVSKRTGRDRTSLAVV